MTTPSSQPPPYLRVANELRSSILDGDLRPGDKLPSQNELGGRYSLNRMTIKRAIDVLEAEGLVYTNQGQGSFVRKRPHVNLLSTGTNYRQRRQAGVSNFNAEVSAQGQRPEQRILEVAEVPAPSSIAERLGLEEGATVLVRRREFFVDDEPTQLVDSYYPLSVAADTALAVRARIRGGAHAVIEDPEGPVRRRIVQFVEDLNVRMPSPEESVRLKIPSGVPIARVLRAAHDSTGQVVEVNDSLVPCDRHAFRYIIDVP